MTRYEVGEIITDETRMEHAVESPTGKWVRYEEVEAFTHRLAESERAAYDVEGTIDSLKRQVEALTHTWTNEKPSRPGWYWWQHQGLALIVYIYEAHAGLYVDFCDDENAPLATTHGKWSDKPIALPQEIK